LSKPSRALAFLRAEWRDLVMLNFEVSPALLEPLVPAGVEIDRWGGRLYASVVGFRFRRTRVLSVPIPGHRTFEEVNLRFYVRRHVGREVRRGVVFVRELVPRRAIAWAARLLYNEPYRALPMRCRIEALAGADIVRREFAWRAGTEWARVVATTAGSPRPLVSGSEEEFITEHYWGYTRQRDGGTIEYRVDHPRWNVWTAVDARLQGNIARVYGDAFAEALGGAPTSAFVADGSPVTVFAPSRIR
jgi:uncharacterized protein YqjF (DUF2071 family)